MNIWKLEDYLDANQSKCISIYHFLEALYKYLIENKSIE